MHRYSSRPTVAAKMEAAPHRHQSITKPSPCLRLDFFRIENCPFVSRVSTEGREIDFRA